MKRLLLNLLTLLSLLICVAAAAGWVRSRWYTQQAVVTFGDETFSAVLARGEVVAAWATGWAEYGRRSGQKTRGVSQQPLERSPYRTGVVSPMDRHALGFGWRHRVDRDPDGTMIFRVVAAPCWAVMAVALLLPAARVALAVRRRRRLRAGHCRRCGYDLRATPDRCPECGEDAVAGGVAT